ncbi:MAG: HNH endonuclease [Nostocales cyanobacterium ELA583]|jgi:5-methylcytosine-specific restriction endonuclease McrA
MDGTNPGQQLRDLLKRIYPFTLEDLNSSDSEDNSFVSRIDDALIAEGNFSNLVYESSINYLLRRLINTAEYLRRKYESDIFPPEQFLFELRRFITENTHIESDKVEIILSLLKLCIDAKDKELKSPRKRRIFKNAQQNDQLCCYICGKELEKREEVQVEHIWPKAMGGATEDFNLKLCCSYCNNAKKNYIDATDFHYEQICLVSDKDDKYFSTELKREYKIAIWAKNNYSCSVCNKPALSVGKLNFGRLNQDDSWHFLNIEAYCNEHTPE